MMQKKKAIIWDLDGTLMDTLQDLHLAVSHALAVYGMPQRTLEQTRMAVGNGVRKLMMRSIPEGEANPQFEDVFGEFRRYYVDHCRDHSGPYPGVIEALAALREMRVKMAIVSNKLQAGVDELYAEWFAPYVDVAIGERPPIPRKPAPDMVHLALDALCIQPEEAYYVGDSDVDILTAQASHLDCLSVLWGFRDEDFLLAHGATRLVASPHEIVQLMSHQPQ